MRAVNYMAILEKGQDGYSVYFPDLPGCISWGANRGEAIRNATEALELHVYGMESDDETLPKPRCNAPGGVAITIFPDEVRDEMEGVEANNAREVCYA